MIVDDCLRMVSLAVRVDRFLIIPMKDGMNPMGERAPLTVVTVSRRIVQRIADDRESCRLRRRQTARSCESSTPYIAGSPAGYLATRSKFTFKNCTPLPTKTVPMC